MRGLPAVLVLCFAAALTARSGHQPAAEDAIRSLVERFFLAQEAEDVDAYLSLWAESGERPKPASLEEAFARVDDRFSDIALVRSAATDGRIRVRVSAVRQRVTQRSGAAKPAPYTSKVHVSLTLVREEGEWKILRQGQPADDLAAALIEATGAAERERLLKAESGLLNEELLVAISRRAGQASRLQNYSAAVHGYELMREVAQRVGSERYEAEALQNLGNARYFLKDFARALQSYEERLTLDRARDNDAGVASGLLGIATVRYTLAEYPSALAAYREALAIQEAIGEDLSIATTLLSIGNVQFLLGDFAAAIAAYERSRELYRRGLNPVGEEDALEGLGRVFLARGDYGAALAAFERVMEGAVARADRASQGTAGMSIGEVHFRLGNIEAARAAYEQSRTQFEGLQDLANAGRVWQALGLVELAAGRNAGAERNYAEGRSLCRTIEDAECVAAATVGLAFAQAAQEKFDSATALYREGIEAFTRLSMDEPAARAEVGLANALRGGGNYPEAIAAARHARSVALRLNNDDVMWRALAAEARALRAAENRAEALRVARAAAYAVDRMRGAVRTKPGVALPSDTADAFALLAVLHAEAGDAAAAFDATERLRAHDVRRRLAAVERDITRGMTDAEREEERGTAADVIALQARLAREQGLPRPDSTRIAELERHLGEALDRREASQRRLFDRLPDLRIWRGLIEPATTSELAAFLERARTALLSFVVDEDALLILTARTTSGTLDLDAHVMNLSRRTLAERVARLGRPGVLQDAAAWELEAASFLKDWPAAVAEHLADAERVMVVSHEFLWRVPFEPLLRGVSKAPLGGVTYGPSITSLTRFSTDESPNPTGRTVVAGAPAFEPAVVERMTRTSPGWKPRPDDRASRELDVVTDTWDEDQVGRLAGAEATEAALRSTLPSAGIVHLAAPFRMNAASPLFSPLVLAGGPSSDDENDGVLELREVMNLDLAAEAVVISDCSAFSGRDAAEETSILHWAWRAAGVPRLVTCRWQTDGDAADLFFQTMYEHLRGGSGLDAAVAAARARLRDSDRYSAPFYWAGWAVIGAADDRGRSRVPE